MPWRTSRLDDGATYFEAKLYTDAVPPTVVTGKIVDLAADDKGQVDTWKLCATSEVPALNAETYRNSLATFGVGCVIRDGQSAMEDIRPVPVGGVLFSPRTILRFGALLDAGVSEAGGEVLTPSLIRAARALLGYDQVMLAEKTGISRKTIALIETMKPGPMDPRRRRMLEDLRRKMEDQMDVEFVFASAKSGEGVRLRNPRGGPAVFAP